MAVEDVFLDGQLYGDVQTRLERQDRESMRLRAGEDGFIAADEGGGQGSRELVYPKHIICITLEVGSRGARTSTSGSSTRSPKEKGIWPGSES